MFNNALESLNTFWDGKLHYCIWVTSERITSEDYIANIYTARKKVQNQSGTYSRREEAASTTG